MTYSHLHIAAAAFSIILCSCVNDTEPRSVISAGDRVPEFSVTMADGSVVRSPSSLSGKVSVIAFFSTSCSDCQAQLPELQKAYDRSEDVGFILIARQETKESIEAYWLENSLSLPYSPQSDRSIYNMFAISGIPRVYVVDPSLTIAAQFGPEGVSADTLCNIISTLTDSSYLNNP